MQIVLCWASRSLIDPVSPEMLAIVRSSVPCNAALGITGVLYFDRTSFFQILEGERHRVEATFRRIATDERHTEVTHLGSRPIVHREFGDAPMRFVDGTRHRHCAPQLDFDRVVTMGVGQRRAAALALLRT